MLANLLAALYATDRETRRTHHTAPLNPYADSRARVEATLTRAASAGLRSASLRYFNAAGADIGSEIGEAHEPETHLLHWPSMRR